LQVAAEIDKLQQKY